MKKTQLRIWKSAVISTGLLGFVCSAGAQVWTFHDNDLVLGFRKNAPYTEAYEVVVDIGQASNYTSLAVGQKISVPGYSTTQLSPGSFGSLNNLSWSVFGFYSGSGYSGYIADSTLWLTVPRTNVSVSSITPYRLASDQSQFGVATSTQGITGAGGAGFISLNDPASQYNTATFVRETLSTYSGHNLSTWLASLVDPTKATFNDKWPAQEPNGGNIENTTPGSFTGSTRSDLYEIRPLRTRSGADVDPHVGTNSTAWYVGYFEFKSDGTITFTRDVATVVIPQPQLSIGRTGAVSTISFLSSSGATYQLGGTNSIGATTTNWPVLGTISGDGTKKSFTHTNSVSGSFFYRVTAH